MALLLLALPLLPAQAIPTTHLPATVAPRARATPHPHRSVHEAKIVHRFVPELQVPAASALSPGSDLVNVTRDLGANNPSAQWDGTQWCASTASPLARHALMLAPTASSPRP